jgi:two-component system response regulator NreC
VTKKIRLLIADDHVIVRKGIRLLLEAEPDLEIVGEALDGNEAIEKAESLQPDIVLMDIAMTGLDGLEATRQIKTNWPEIQVLVLTMHRSDEYFFEMIKAGASGYILKGAETNDLKSAIRLIGSGGVFLYPNMVQKLIKGYVEASTGNLSSISTLSTREKEVLKLISEGYSNQEIAKELVISPSTVHTHRSNVMTKLGLTKRHELVKYARDNELI